MEYVLPTIPPGAVVVSLVARVPAAAVMIAIVETVGNSSASK